jgi:DNA primase large subunit
LSLKLGPADLAKYPFLDEASSYIRETTFAIDEFDRPDMDHIVSRAVNRLETEILAGKVNTDLERYEVEILTFLATLLLVKALNFEPVTRKYSLLEAIRAEKFLTDDLIMEKSYAKKKLLLYKVFEDLFRIKVDAASETNLLKMRVADYLNRATKMNEQEWKLINRSVDSGYVFLDAEEAVRLIRSELSNLIYERLKIMRVSSMPTRIRNSADKLKHSLHIYSSFKEHHPIADYPPCIKHAVSLMNRGENLPHSARLMLGTYMLGIGKQIHEIIDMFRNAPDFNEKITRYQVEHLAGNKGSRIKYSVPSCKKLQAEDLCFATTDCEGIYNPIQFGRTNKQVTKDY